MIATSNPILDLDDELVLARLTESGLSLHNGATMTLSISENASTGYAWLV